MQKIILLLVCLLALAGIAWSQRQALPGVRQLPAKPVTPKSAEPAAPSSAPPKASGRQVKTKSVASFLPVKVDRAAQKIFTADGRVYPLRFYKPLISANDPLANQWWNNSINIDPVWSRGAGPNPTLLAMVDTGFALQHEEFNGRWYQNPGETGATTQENPSRLNCTDRGLPLDQSCNLIDDNNDGIVDNESGPTNRQNPSLLNCTDRGLPLDKSCNLIDDDKNGLVDDASGYDFVSQYPSVQAGKENPQAAVDTEHGTMTTGVAAATGNNNKGIAGIDWHTKILPLQAINDDGYGDSLTVSAAVRYAADQGANVISLSLGTAADDPYLHQAIDYAISKGSMVVAAAGNDGCECLSYPAAYSEVISVGALDTDNQHAYFSSWGPNLKIAAPGVNINTSVWLPSNQTSAYAYGVAGTSFSTPMVAGLLTLELSYQPHATAAQLLNSLTSQALGPWSKTPYNHDEFIGYGRLQAWPSLNMAIQGF